MAKPNNLEAHLQPLYGVPPLIFFAGTRIIRPRAEDGKRVRLGHTLLVGGFVSGDNQPLVSIWLSPNNEPSNIKMLPVDPGQVTWEGEDDQTMAILDPEWLGVRQLRGYMRLPTKTSLGRPGCQPEFNNGRVEPLSAAALGTLLIPQCFPSNHDELIAQIEAEGGP